MPCPTHVQSSPVADGAGEAGVLNSSFLKLFKGLKSSPGREGMRRGYLCGTGRMTVAPRTKLIK